MSKLSERLKEQRGLTNPSIPQDNNVESNFNKLGSLDNDYKPKEQSKVVSKENFFDKASKAYQGVKDIIGTPGRLIGENIIAPISSVPASYLTDLIGGRKAGTTMKEVLEGKGAGAEGLKAAKKSAGGYLSEATSSAALGIATGAVGGVASGAIKTADIVQKVAKGVKVANTILDYGIDANNMIKGSQEGDTGRAISGLIGTLFNVYGTKQDLAIRKDAKINLKGATREAEKSLIKTAPEFASDSPKKVARASENFVKQLRDLPDEAPNGATSDMVEAIAAKKRLYGSVLDVKEKIATKTLGDVREYNKSGQVFDDTSKILGYMANNADRNVTNAISNAPIKTIGKKDVGSLVDSTVKKLSPKLVDMKSSKIKSIIKSNLGDLENIENISLDDLYRLERRLTSKNYALGDDAAIILSEFAKTLQNKIKAVVPGIGGLMDDRNTAFYIAGQLDPNRVVKESVKQMKVSDAPLINLENLTSFQKTTRGITQKVLGTLEQRALKEAVAKTKALTDKNTLKQSISATAKTIKSKNKK